MRKIVIGLMGLVFMVLSAYGSNFSPEVLRYDIKGIKAGNKTERKKTEWLYATPEKKTHSVSKLVIHQSKNPCLLIPEDYVDGYSVKRIDENTVVFVGSRGKGKFKFALSSFSDQERYDIGNRLLIKKNGAMVDKQYGDKIVQLLGKSPSCINSPTIETWTMYHYYYGGYMENGKNTKKKYKLIGKVKFYLN